MKSQAIIFPPYKNEPEKPLTEVQKEILRLKKEKDAVILAHNYVAEEIQRVADFVGDSLGLSRQAKAAKESVIVFCGVHFMAETAKILNPTKTVVLPDLEAGCCLAESCKAEDLAELKKKHPDAMVISYINCNADVKAISDLICTSGNALELVKKIPADKEIIFCPDKYLGSWIIEQTGRDMILWNGSCYAHEEYDAESILEMKKEFNAPAVGHPECPRAVRQACDCVCSTEKMIAWAKNHPSDKIIVVTVTEMIHRLRKAVPEKTFIAARLEHKPCQHCKFMQKNTAEKLLNCLKTMRPEITLSPEIIAKAAHSINKMLEMS